MTTPVTGRKLTATAALWLAGVAAYFVVVAMNSRLVDYWQDIVLQCSIAVILATSLNIVNGLTGQFSIGHAGFMSIGAYTGASITYYASMQHPGGPPPGLAWMLAAMLAGGIVAGFFGWLVGVPSLRLRGDYLAIVTLGFGEIIRVLLENSTSISQKLNYLGGATGFTGDSGAYTVPHLSAFPLVLATVAIVVLLIRNLKFSSHGLAFMSIREDEIAADSMGVNTTRVKVSAFVLGAFFAGVGGVLFAHAFFIQPKTFNFILSMNYVVMIVLGGTGSITGAVLAAVALTALPEYLKTAQDTIHFDDAYRLVVYAIVLVLMMILRPSGVFGMGELGFASFRRRRHHATVQQADEPPLETGAVKPVTGAALNLDKLTRRFGGLVAVGDVDLTVGPGELVGLIGPNGAGKTTVFNLLTGVYEPSAGSVSLDGATLAGENRYPTGIRLAWTGFDAVLAAAGGLLLSGIVVSAIVPPGASGYTTLVLVLRALLVAVPVVWSLGTAKRRRSNRPGLKPYQFARRGISRTFQNIRLFRHLTVLENVEIACHLHARTNLVDAMLHTRRLKHEQAASRALALELLRRFNLARVAGEVASSLPYGDQRRLEIVRALATRPRLLLLDEPAAGMNPQEKSELMGLIRRVRDDFGVSILLIEHDMTLVMGVCERIYVLDYGRIISEGTPEAIRQDPRVIAAYLGEDESDPVEEPSGSPLPVPGQ